MDECLPASNVGCQSAGDARSLPARKKVQTGFKHRGTMNERSQPRSGEFAVRASGGSGNTNFPPIILVVDDDDSVRATAVAFLKYLGYGVREAANSEQAMQLLRGPAPIDLLFTDICLGDGQNGEALARVAQQWRRELRVVLTSGLGNLALSSANFCALRDRVLTKPYTMQELSKIIDHTLHTQ